MFAIDFIYDGIKASDYGLILCTINDSGGINITPTASTMNFNQVSTHYGGLWLNTAVTYDAPLEATFQVCKYICNGDNDSMYLNMDEQRAIGRWLGKKTPRVLCAIGMDSPDDDRFFEGMFDSINKLSINGKIIGYELHFIANKPYATGVPIIVTLHSPTANYEHEFFNHSDETGFVYPDSLKVTCNASGDLILRNSMDSKTMIVKNCSVGETITVDNLLNISSSNTSHKLSKDFNFSYFRIGKSDSDNINIISASLPCDIEFVYKPVLKGVGL